MLRREWIGICTVTFTLYNWVAGSSGLQRGMSGWDTPSWEMHQVLLPFLHSSHPHPLIPVVVRRPIPIHYIQVLFLLKRTIFIWFIIIIIIIILECLTTDHKVAGSIPGTSTDFKCGLGLERVHPATWGQLGSYLIEKYLADLIKKVGIIRLDGA